MPPYKKYGSARDTAVPEDVSHQQISSYFIGPQAENLSYFENNIRTILKELGIARTNYFGGDGQFITADVQNTEAFQKSMETLNRVVQKASNLMGRTSIPFWSPRYEAHMCTDLSMSSVLGYFMTMLYNPNNVALEASPISTVAEIEVGEQLCDLFGYNVDEDDTDDPTAWGHVTCDGTVANLESMWVARNLKFYPLSLRQAMEKGNPLDFAASRFYIENCQGEQKLFSALTTWELLNLKSNVILDIPDRLYEELGISNDFLSGVMNKFTIQSTGKDALEKVYGLDQPCQYMLATSRHYSWPKSGAIAGIGSDNVVGVPVDNAARVDVEALEEMLETNLQEGRPVYAVVAIIGSTEEGAVDSLSSILALRKKFQTKGMSFLVHADAAWGGYFCTMLPKDYRPGDVVNLPTEMGAGSGFVPDACLRAETQYDLYALRYADSITVDPHKAGYIPYPAGGLCYRDGRMRFLVTWTSPYLSRGSVTSIGIYGVEGSKPGASAMSTWLSNKTIGLDQGGYGALLGEVTWTCTRLSAEWAALTDTTSPFICVPFNELPSELVPDSTPAMVEAEKLRIRREIVEKTNAEIIAEDQKRPDDQKAMKLMRDLGSDLNINAFALNFRYSDGTVNTDVEEANYLMQRVVQAFSVDSPSDDPTKIPLYLTSTEFSDELYGSCKAHFMERLQLDPSAQDLMVLRNVVMSPFPTERSFIRELAQIFYDRVEAETEIVLKRNEVTEDFHSFLMQGVEKIYLIHMPMFHMANHRQQLILQVDMDEEARSSYRDLKRCNPTEPMLLVTQEKTFLREIVESDQEGEFIAQIMTKESGIILKDIHVTVKKIVVSRPLNSKWRLKDYPANFMPFYLYGSANEINIDHVITRAPNTQLSAAGCKLEVEGLDESTWEGKDLVLTIDDTYEAPMQPFPANSVIGTRHGAIVAVAHGGPVAGGNVAQQQQQLLASQSGADGRGIGVNFGVHLGGAGLGANLGFGGSSSKGGGGDNNNKDSSSHPNQPDGESHNGAPRNGVHGGMKGGSRGAGPCGSTFFFRPGAQFRVRVWEDEHRTDESTESAAPDKGPLIGEGMLTLGPDVYVDSEAVNFDPYRKPERMAEWRYEFDQIGKEFD